MTPSLILPSNCRHISEIVLVCLRRISWRPDTGNPPNNIPSDVGVSIHVVVDLIPHRSGTAILRTRIGYPSVHWFKQDGVRSPVEILPPSYWSREKFPPRNVPQDAAVNVATPVVLSRNERLDACYFRSDIRRIARRVLANDTPPALVVYALKHPEEDQI